MKSGFNSRQLVLWSVLALSVLATIWTALTEDEDQDIAVAAVGNDAADARPAASNTDSNTSDKTLAYAPSQQRIQLAALTLPDHHSAADNPLDTRQLQRPRWEGVEANEASNQLYDPFQGNKPLAAAEAAPLQAAQQVMEIPPLPFSYAGKLMDNGQYTVFLSAGEQNYSVKRGDVVQGWQVKSISPPTMIMRYQAMQMDVPLMIGEQN